MSRNESTADRLVRLVLAAAALAVAVTLGLSSVGGLVLLAVAAVLGVTATVGFCPLYRVLGISTCPVPR